MKKFICLFLLICTAMVWAAKTHSVVFGKITVVPWFTGAKEDQKQQLKIRPLFVDDKLREFTMGERHDVTDRMFVVRRAYRVNDQLPDESGSPRWKWQRDGWLLVDRESGRVTALKLPEFDPFYSATSWYRDYVAYCGVSSDAEKFYAVVAQIGVRKPIVRKELGTFNGGEQPDSACPAPEWQRQPARVSFHPPGMQPMSFGVHGTSAETAAEESSEE
jgi:hypothetical protein